MKFLAVLCVVGVGVASAFDFCSICEAGVQEIISVANGNEDKAKALLEAECKKHLSHSWEVDMCNFAVDEAVKEIMSLVNQHLSAQQVCQKVHLCSSRAADQARLSENQLCQYCDAAVAQVINALENGNLADQADAICQKLGIGASRCQQVISYIKGLIANLGKDPNAVCSHFLPFCGSSMGSKYALKANGGQFCPYCKEGVAVLKNMVEKEVPALVNDIKALCQKLPGEEASICEGLVSQYGATIIEKLLSLLDADKLCTAIKLCTAGVNEAAIFPKAGDGVDWDPVKCNFCKMVFEFIQKNFMSQDFENGLLLDLAKACKAIDDPKYQQECMDILASYGELILNYIKTLISPDHMCPLMNACPKPTIPSFLA